MPRPDLEAVIRRAMSQLPWDTSGATIATDHIPSPVADEDQLNDSVIRADTTDAIASIEDQMGFDLDRFDAIEGGLQAAWDDVATEIGKRLGIDLCAELWQIQALVLLMR